MALSNQRVVSDGTLTTLDISFDYFDQSEIEVYFDSVEQPPGGGAWMWGSNRNILFIPAVPAGVEVLLQRKTDASAVRHAFSRGSAFRADTLDENFKQVLHIAQEAVESNFSKDFFDDVNMNGHRILNLPHAQLPNEPVTLAQLSSVATPVNTLRVFGTYAEAVSAASALLSGTIVEAPFNDTARRYVVVSGALVPIPAPTAEGTLNVRAFIDTPVDGVTSNQDGIVAAVAAALSVGAALTWPRGTYVSTANIPNLWAVDHIGPGVITRGGYTWFITPRVSTHVNEMHCSPTAGLGNNDGITPDAPCTVQTTFTSRLRLLGEKAARGQWRVRWLGSGQADGVIMSGLPYFGNALQIWGEDAAVYAELPSKWDGTASAASYALRTNHGNTALALDLRNIEFINWTKDVGNSGAFTNDDRLRMEVFNCKFTDTDIGIWVLQSYIRVRASTFTRCRTWGVNVSYLSYGNIGTSGADNANRFYECGVPISVARNSVAYAQNNDFYTIVDRAIEVNKQSRARSLENRFHSWSDTPSTLRSVYYTSEGGLLNNDNASGTPDTFLLPITDTQPVYRSSVGGTHWHLQRETPLVLHTRKALDLAYTTNTRTLVPGADPLRVPAYAMYTESFRCVFEVLLTVSAGKSFSVDIAGAGTSTAARIAYATFAAPTSASTVMVRFTVTKIGTSMYFYVECPALGVFSYIGDSSTALAQAAVRSATDAITLFRLYVTPGSEAGSVTVRRLETWVQF